MDNLITHSGIVSEINGTLVKVIIETPPACGNCHAKSICSAGNSSKKIIEVITNDSHNYSLNDKVNVIIKTSTGYKAVLFGYILPLLLIIKILIIGKLLNINEIKTALYSLAILFPYYLILYYFRNLIKKRITFNIAKQL